MDIQRLIEALELTECGGAQLDAHIHALTNCIYDYSFNGSYLKGKRDLPFYHEVIRPVPAYTSSIDLALKLVAQQLPGFSYSLHSGRNAEIYSSGSRYEGPHKDMPVAICIATLKGIAALGPRRESADLRRHEVGVFG